MAKSSSAKTLEIPLPSGARLQAFGEKFFERLPEAEGPGIRISARAGSAEASCAWRCADALEADDWGLPDSGRPRYRFADIACDASFDPHALFLGFLKREAGLDDEGAFVAMAEIFRSLDASDRRAKPGRKALA